MGINTKAIFIIILFIIRTEVLVSQWENSDGITGGNITYLAATESIIVAGTSNGIFRSTDSGVLWKKPLTRGDIRCITTDGQIFFAGTFLGLFISKDGGMNWARNVSLGTGKVNSIAILKERVLLGTDNGIKVSTDKGENWTLALLENHPIGVISVSDSIILAATSDSGVYLSVNEGMNWKSVGLTGISIGAMAIAGNNLLASSIGGTNVMFSTDHGNSWMISDLPDARIRSFVRIGEKVIAATSQGIAVSTNNGVNWKIGVSDTTIDGVPISSVHSFAANSTKIYAGLSRNSIIESTTMGNTWATAHSGMSSRYINYVNTGNDKLYVGGDQGTYTSTNNGNSWLNAGFLKSSSFSNIGTNVFIAVNGYVYHSTNDGKYWRDTTSGLPTNPNVNSLISVGSSLFAGTWGNGIYRTMDYARSWSYMAKPSEYIGQLITDGSVIYAATWDGVFMSTDEGNTWNKIPTGLPSGAVKSIALTNTHLFAAMPLKGVYRLGTDGVWTSVNAGLSDLNVNCFLVSGDNLYIGTKTNGVFISSLTGDSWRSVSSGLGKKTVNALAESGPFIVAATDSGMWRRPFSEMITAVERTSIKNSMYSLYQNYPNPFNPTTTIDYALPINGHTKIVVFDVLGREVAVLVNEFKMAGKHKITFNAHGLTTGTYFYQLQNNEYITTKRFHLIK